MSLTLTPEELIEVTGYKRGAEQLGYFKELDVPAHRRPDGSVAVVRQHLLDLRRDDKAAFTNGARLHSDEKTTPARLRKTQHLLVR